MAGPRRTEEAAFAPVDAAIRDGLGVLYPGAVVLIAHRGEVVHAAAFGDAQALGARPDGRAYPLAAPRPMTLDTVFDLASVTKVAATTVAVIRLVGEGRLGLDDALGALLPDFAATDKALVTVRQLLAHRGGLWEWQPTWRHGRSPEAVRRYLAALPRRYPIGARHAYSDLGFMLLGAIVARIAGMSLDRFVRTAIHAPLGMVATGFRPAGAAVARCAATSIGDGFQRHMAESGEPFPAAPDLPPTQPAPRYRRRTLIGEVNDANAWLGWGGVAGHAGLFAPAGDLLRLTRALLDRDARLAPATTIAAFEARPFDADQALGLKAFAVPGLAEPFLGHTGFTGTFLAYSRELSTSVALLTNRVHRVQPDGVPYPLLTPLHDMVLRAMAEAFGVVDQRMLARKPTRKERPSRSE